MRKSGYFISICLFILLSCDGELPDNALDPNSGDFIDPETTIISGPSEGSILIINTVTFEFSGNEQVNAYSHKLVFGSQDAEAVAWSEWSSDSIAVFDKLDEGVHTFYVKGQYPTEDEDLSPASVSFTIDAVAGPSVRVFPQVMNITQNTIFSIDVYAEDIDDVAGIQLEIEYSSNMMSINGDIEAGQLLDDFSGTEIVIDDISSGGLTMTIGLVDETLSGTGSLFRINFNANAIGTSNITINSAELRDEDNNLIETEQIISGEVIIQ